MNLTTRCGAFAVIVAWCTCGEVSAAQMNYGDFMGDTLTYEQVTETNGGPALLYSTPSTVGDVLVFDPVNFFSEVDPGPGASTVASTLTTVVKAKPGFGIDNLMIMEAGDYTLVGQAADLAMASVAAGFTATITEINGVAVAGPVIVADMQFTTGAGPNGGIYSTPGDSGTTQIWKGTAMLDVQGVLPPGQVATEIELSFMNTLDTSSDAITAAAFIKKKQLGGIMVMPNVIPEPAAAGLALLTLVGICGSRRQRT